MSEYSKSDFVRDMDFIQKHIEQEDQLLESGLEDCIIGGYLMEGFVNLIAQQFVGDGESIKMVSDNLWWFISDNMFGRVGDNPDGDSDAPIESPEEMYDYLVIA